MCEDWEIELVFDWGERGDEGDQSLHQAPPCAVGLEVLGCFVLDQVDV